MSKKGTPYKPKDNPWITTEAIEKIIKEYNTESDPYGTNAPSNTFRSKSYIILKRVDRLLARLNTADIMMLELEKYIDFRGTRNSNGRY